MTRRRSNELLDPALHRSKEKQRSGLVQASDGKGDLATSSGEHCDGNKNQRNRAMPMERYRLPGVGCGLNGHAIEVNERSCF